YGRAMAQMASVFAELERAMIRERPGRGWAVRGRLGRVFTGPPPFAWAFDPAGFLWRNAPGQRVIARVARWGGEGLSYRGIAARLDGEGILPKRGRRWIHTTVKSILSRNAA